MISQPCPMLYLLVKREDGMQSLLFLLTGMQPHEISQNAGGRRGTLREVGNRQLKSLLSWPRQFNVDSLKLGMEQWLRLGILTGRMVWLRRCSRGKEPVRRNFAQQGIIGSGSGVWIE